MSESSLKLELRLIMEKLSGRISFGRSLSANAWNPKCLDLLPGERILVVSPHPDDDAIGCGGTILKALAMGKAVRICYLSLPTIGTRSLSERRDEIMKSLKVLGVSEYSLNEHEFPETVRALRDIIRSELDEWKPDCVLVPSPLENHSQHIMSFKAYVEAMRASQRKIATALYEVWGPVVPNVVVDVTGYTDKKSKSIAAHVSQVEQVDYVRMAKALNEYRAISSGRSGYAEAFLYLEGEDLLRMFP